MILTAYIDEAGTHAGSPVTVMGGYVARLGQWHHFDQKWDRILKRYRISHKHTKDMLHGSGEFKRWTQDRALALLRETEKIIDQHMLFGFSTFVTDKDYLEMYAAEWPTKIPLDTRYGLCFRLVMSLVPKKVFEEERRDDLTLNVVLESGPKNAGDAVRIFNLFKKQAPPELAKMAGKISFGEKKKFPGLQAADGIASSVFQFEKKPPKEPIYFPHNVYDEPIKVGRARRYGATPVYRLEATPKVLQDFRDNIFGEIEARKYFGRKTIHKM
jgi:hypothetical protein